MDPKEQVSVDPPKMDATNVPAMLQAGRIDTNMMMDISSDVIDPIHLADLYYKIKDIFTMAHVLH